MEISNNLVMAEDVFQNSQRHACFNQMCRSCMSHHMWRIRATAKLVRVRCLCHCDVFCKNLLNGGNRQTCIPLAGKDIPVRLVTDSSVGDIFIQQLSCIHGDFYPPRFFPFSRKAVWQELQRSLSDEWRGNSAVLLLVQSWKSFFHFQILRKNLAGVISFFYPWCIPVELP